MILQSSLFSGLDVFHGFSLRGGSDLSFQNMDSSHHSLWVLHGIERVAWVKQVHGDAFVHVDGGGLQGTADALITSNKGVGLVIRTADCVPVLVYNGMEVAAIHAGWRGLKANIIGKTISAMRRSKNVTAVVGPCICSSCYEVGEEVVDHLLVDGIKESMFVDRSKAKPHVNLKSVAEHQLKVAGVNTIDVMSECTMCDERFHSYRRDGSNAGRMASVIGLQ